MYGRGIIFIFISMLLLISCGGEDAVEQEIESSNLEITFKRFDKDLFGYKERNASVDVAELRKSYGSFVDLYVHQILNIPEGGDTGSVTNLNLFVNDPDISEVYNTVGKVYENTGDINQEFTDFIRHYHYYYPDETVPAVVTFISAFNYAIITTDSIIGVGLDMFAGPDYEFYSRLGIPRYMSEKFSREYIVPAAVKGWYQSDYNPEELGKEFINQVVYQGKLFYYLDKMLPGIADTLKTGYSQSELEWCKENESDIWAFFIEKNMLFNTDPTEYSKYLNDGPGTNGFPKEAPDRIGAWIGWQIVKKYMDEEDVTFIQLMNEKDGLKILEKSGYKPQR